MRIKIKTVGGESVVILPPSMLEQIGNPDEVDVEQEPGRIVVTNVDRVQADRHQAQVAENMEDAAYSDAVAGESGSKAGPTSKVIRRDADTNNFTRDPRLPSIDEIQNRGREVVVDPNFLLDLITRATPAKESISGRKMSYEGAKEATFQQYDETFKRLAEDD